MFDSFKLVSILAKHNLSPATNEILNKGSYYSHFMCIEVSSDVYAKPAKG